MKEPIGEYKVLIEDKSALQTMLNQWRHDYMLDIIHATPLVEGGKVYVVAIILRTRK